MKWKTLLSEYVVKEPWMTVRKDKLLLPDGRVKDDYWSLEYPDWINVTAIISLSGNIVMVWTAWHGRYLPA